MKLTDLGFWNTPMGARPVTGARDELGNPVYQDVAGNQFNVMPAPAQEQGPGLLDMLAGIYRLAGGRGSEQDQAAATGLLGAVTQGLTAPGRAAQGEMVTNGDVWSTALDYGVMGAPMAAPEGALRAGPLQTWHGSPIAGLTELRASTEGGAMGPGVYTSPFRHVAQRYGDNVYEVTADNYFNGLGRHGVAQDVNTFQLWRDEVAAIVNAAPEAQRPIIQAAADRAGNDGYAFFRDLERGLGGTQAAQDAIKRGGFNGISANIDGPEILTFGNVPARGN